MKIESAQIRNFRILRDLEVDFENELSVIIGKNNTGKTSFLSVLEKFLSLENPVFSFEDLSINEQKKICELEGTNLTVEEYVAPFLSLKLLVSYSETDDISSASEFLLDLDYTISHFVLLMEYSLSYEKYQKLVCDFKETKSKIDGTIFRDYVSKNAHRYFAIKAYALEYGNETCRKEIALKTIQQVISMKVIEANRDVNNEQGRAKSLSNRASRYYTSKGSDVAFPSLQQQLLKADTKLTNEYRVIFNEIIKEIREMSYNPSEAELEIISSLTNKPIFQDNTIVKYKHNDTLLPEDYNGLGYLNLFAIIFDIRTKLDVLAKKNNKEETPTPINLLFIEEPEAYTHPQMQYVFRANIERILKKQQTEVPGFNLQTIISTHSAHIVSQCDFKDIKYFYRDDTDGSNVKSKGLINLHSAYKGYAEIVASLEEISEQNAEVRDEQIKKEQDRAFRFVKQYVTLNRSELFFADKAILIEGDTERMLLSAMMKKYDEIHRTDEGYTPLLSQNISVIEVGAYSHVFAIFLGFIGVKTLVLTDLDCAKKNANNRNVKCAFAEATTTSNASIKHFLKTDTVSDIVTLADNKRTFSYDAVKHEWVQNDDGVLRLNYQTKVGEYQPASFEDAFLALNMDFVVRFKESFQGLKNRDDLDTTSTNYYELAQKCIDGKTTFALDVLMHSNDDIDKWDIPNYITGGLQWLSLQ